MCMSLKHVSLLIGFRWLCVCVSYWIVGILSCFACCFIYWQKIPKQIIIFNEDSLFIRFHPFQFISLLIMLHSITRNSFNKNINTSWSVSGLTKDLHRNVCDVDATSHVWFQRREEFLAHIEQMKWHDVSITSTNNTMKCSKDLFFFSSFFHVEKYYEPIINVMWKKKKKEKQIDRLDRKVMETWKWSDRHHNKAFYEFDVVNCISTPQTITPNARNKQMHVKITSRELVESFR